MMSGQTDIANAHPPVGAKGLGSNRARMVFALGLGLVAGGALRPYLVRAGHALIAVPTPPEPKLPALYECRAGQFEVLDALGPSPAVVYLGDSLTDWINLEEYWRSTAGPVVNRAIAGDTTAGVLRRVARSFPNGAAVCFLMIGYNDLSQGASPAETADRIGQLCSLLKSRHGVRRIVVESLLPVSGREGAAVATLNALLRAGAAGDANVEFLDLYPAFLAGAGPDPSLFAGRVHLNARGIARRLEREADYLAEVAPELCVQLRSGARSGS